MTYNTDLQGFTSITILIYLIINKVSICKHTIYTAKPDTARV